MLYIAIGILGATVMPHNLYLHSSIAQTRAFERNDTGKAMAIKFATIDSTVALFFAFFINAAILILSAAAFHGSGHQDVADISDAYQLLSPVLGASLAGTLFGVALSGIGAECDTDGDDGGTDRDGGIPGHSTAPLGATDDDPVDRDRAGGYGGGALWK